MSIELTMDSKKIKSDINTYGIVILVFLFILILYIFSGSKIYSNISPKLESNKELQSEILTLKTKAESLKNIKDVDYGDIDVLSFSFPEEDSSLYMYSSLKQLAVKYNILISDISFSKPDLSEGVSTTGISFIASGIKENMEYFLSDITKTAPISGLGTITFEKYPEAGSEFKPNISLKLYFSPYPKTLPAISSIVNPLNEDEKQIYKTLSELNVLFNTDIKPKKANETIEDPFYGMNSTNSAAME